MARKGKLTERTRDVLERPKSMRHYPVFIMILCEDEGWEPYYFGKFKQLFNDIFPKDTVFLVPTGTGRNSKGVVEKAVEGKAAKLTNWKIDIKSESQFRELLEYENKKEEKVDEE